MFHQTNARTLVLIYPAVHSICIIYEISPPSEPRQDPRGYHVGDGTLVAVTLGKLG
jgi:hypothetical protein